jgi:hypothetical protein
LDDFALQHEMLVLDALGRIQEMEEDRRRDVVGQVAEHPQLAGAAGRGRRGR